MQKEQTTNSQKMEFHPIFSCLICGAQLYATDHGNYEITYHCSSSQARFWDFERGTPEANKAKEHWDKSRMEIRFSGK